MAEKKNYIKDKNVVIVGGSNNLVDKNFGAYIDSFDTVVKFNGSLFLHDNKKYIQDYGSRDTLHFLTNPFVREVKPNLKKYSFVEKFLFKRDYKEYQNINREIIKESFKRVESQMQKGFTYSGVAVLDYVLSNSPNHVQLLGWDLYVDKPNYWDGDWSHYPDGYIPQQMKDLTARENADGHLAHSRYWNAIVIKQLLLKNNNTIFTKELWDNINYIIAHREAYE